MSFMPSGQLDQMRADVANMLPDTAIIKAKVEVVDSGGSRRVSFVASGTVACRLDPVTASLRGNIAIIAGRESLENIRQLTVPYDTSIGHGNLITINAANYEIIDLVDDHSWNVSVRLIVERIL
jgi:hypothetical protein